MATWISTQRTCTGNDMIHLKVHNKYERLYDKFSTKSTETIWGGLGFYTILWEAKYESKIIFFWQLEVCIEHNSKSQISITQIKKQSK